MVQHGEQVPASGRRLAQRNVEGLLLAALIGCGALLTALFLMTAGGTPVSSIPGLQQTYLLTEGHLSRGPNFQHLALAVNNEVLSGQTIREARMVQVLGPPDLELRRGGNASFVYFYDRFGKRDWAVYFDYGPGGLSIGWNGVSGNQQMHSRMRPYAATQSAATPPGANPALERTGREGKV